MIEIAAREVVFHFNKKSIEDSSVPPWALKTGGKTYYVAHVDCDIPWSTKETPASAHTKGSIKIKRALITIDDQNCARITSLSKEAAAKVAQKEAQRVLIAWTNCRLTNTLLKDVAHGPILCVSAGACSSDWYVTELYDAEELVQLQLAYYGQVRQLMPNEWQWEDYNKGIGDQVEVDNPM